MLWIDLALDHSVFTKATLLAALLSLSGCIVLPISKHEIYEGSEIKAESLKWLHVGETSHAQVVEELGAPDVDFVDQRTIIYAWSGFDGELLVIVGNGGFYSDRQPIRRALIIRFDPDDKVAAFSIIDRRPKEVIPYDALDQSHDAHLDDWGVTLDQWLAGRIPGYGQTGEGPK